MRIEFIPGHENVERFPLERRLHPQVNTLREMCPDPHEVRCLAEAFQLPEPVWDIQANADKETNAKIATEMTGLGTEERKTILARWLIQSLRTGIDACVQAGRTAKKADQTLRSLQEARSQGLVDFRQLQDHACEITKLGAGNMIAAFIAAQTAIGQAHAIQLALNGHVWSPSLDRDEQSAAQH